MKNGWQRLQFLQIFFSYWLNVYLIKLCISWESNPCPQHYRNTNQEYFLSGRLPSDLQKFQCSLRKYYPRWLVVFVLLLWSYPRRSHRQSWWTGSDHPQIFWADLQLASRYVLASGWFSLDHNLWDTTHPEEREKKRIWIVFVCAILNECRNHHKHQYLDLWLTQWVFSVRLLMLNIWSPQYWRFIMSLIFSSILLLRSPLGHTHNISHNFKISEINSCISNVAHLNTYCTSRIKTLWHSDHFLRHVGTSTRIWLLFLLLHKFSHRCCSWSSSVTASPADGGWGSWAWGVRLTTSTDGTVTPGI